MPQDFTPNINAARTRIIGYTGSEAGSGAKYDEIARQKLEQEFMLTYPGASGIAGAGVRATPAYKQALAAYIAQKSAPVAPQAGPGVMPGTSRVVRLSR